MAVKLKHEWPMIALAGGGVLAFFYLTRSSSSSGPSVIYPHAIGGQRGVQGRQSSSSSDRGSLATQVINAIIGQKVALTQAQDQLKLGEDQLTTEQNIAYRESNVQAQQSVNAEQPPPNGWNQFFGMLFNALPMAFGFPPMGGSFGIPYGGGGYGGGYGGGGYGGYPQMPWWMMLPQWFGGGYPYPSSPYPQTGGGGSGLLW